MPAPPVALRRGLLACACALAVLALAPRPALAAPSAATTVAASVVANARTLIGAPYAYIGDDPTAGFSCIGFVHYLYAQAGISVPYDLNAAYAAGPQVKKADLQLGDLVFFGGTVWDGLSHVAIYAGDDQIIGADNYTTGVELTRLSDPYWQGHYVGATRPWAALALPAPQPSPAPPPAPAPPPVHPGETLAATTAGTMYTGPGYTYPAFDRVLPRVTLRVVRLQGSWTNVVYRGAGSDDYGWIDRRYLNSCTLIRRAVPSHAPASRSAQKLRSAVVMPSLLFLRAGPGRNRTVVAQLRAGQFVTLLGAQGSWERVRSGSVTGWALGRWLAIAPTRV